MVSNNKDQIFNIYFQSCQVFMQVEGLAATIIVGTVDVVLLLRVYVLYGNSKKMLIFLIPLVLCEVILMEIISIFSDLPLNSFAHLDPLLGCYDLCFSHKMESSGLLRFCVYVLAIYMTKRLDIWVIVITSTDIIIWAVGRSTLAEVNIAVKGSAKHKDDSDENRQLDYLDMAKWRDGTTIHGYC
ncbi:hypothetical protein B0H14DRAFT_2560132 [Mycena olivaceomarginata]|nr:hypothetical protein B0H14DRAFT_2560132 [Mycena olivaceomarginata]